MVSIMALFTELMGSIIMFVTRPFSTFKLVFLFSVDSFYIVTHTWIQLLRAAVQFHVNIFWNIMNWTVALISLPSRILTALQRERLLEMHMEGMQLEMENHVLLKKELEQRMRLAIRESNTMESMLNELDDEYEKAISKIELLEGELQDLKEENLRLKEDIQNKGFQRLKYEDDTGIGLETNVFPADKCGSPCGIVQNLIIHGEFLDDIGKRKTEFTHLLQTGSGDHFTPENFPGSLNMDDVLDQQRGVALSQTLFSALLSLLVGIIIWEAEDPCMPLVVALFTVVGISLKSVVQFFSTIKNKPASDAVALLSFNWFILGMLTYPTLPLLARILSPLALRLLERAISWLSPSP